MSIYMALTNHILNKKYTMTNLKVYIKYKKKTFDQPISRKEMRSTALKTIHYLIMYCITYVSYILGNIFKGKEAKLVWHK